MKEIPVSRGQVALVDDSDFEWLSQYEWTATPNRHGWRAYRRSRNGEFPTKRTVYMHQQIMGFPGCEVDHRNRNGLDNRRENLRKATRQQQAANSDWKRPHGFRGILPSRNGQRWEARVGYKLKTVHLGFFDSKVEAALAYDAAAIKFFGEFAVLNFPQQHTTERIGI